MNMYPFIEAEKAEQRSVVRACCVLEVSRAAYYEWRQQAPSQREQKDRDLAEKIKEIHAGSRQTYGAPRVQQALRRQGWSCGRKRVARIMREEDLVGRCPKRWKKTTISDPSAGSAVIDLLRRRFQPDQLALNECWVGDITYVRTWEGWLYLASVIDLGSRRVVGWAMADHMRSDLVCDALRMAITGRRPGRGLVIHSDRGSQYTSAQFTDLLAQYGLRQSLSRPGQCWDNAVAESFFSTLKTELVNRSVLATRAQARRAIFEFVEVFYNRQRIHSSLGYLTPVEWEMRYEQRSRAA